MVVSGHQRRVLGELPGKGLTTPDMLVTNNWTRWLKDQLDKDPWSILYYTRKIEIQKRTCGDVSMIQCGYNPIISENICISCVPFGRPLQNPHHQNDQKSLLSSSRLSSRCILLHFVKSVTDGPTKGQMGPQSLGVFLRKIDLE